MDEPLDGLPSISIFHYLLVFSCTSRFSSWLGSSMAFLCLSYSLWQFEFRNLKNEYRAVNLTALLCHVINDNFTSPLCITCLATKHLSNAERADNRHLSSTALVINVLHKLTKLPLYPPCIFKFYKSHKFDSILTLLFRRLVSSFDF